MNQHIPATDRVLRKSEAFGPKGRIPISNTTVYAWISQGLLAPPVKLGPRISVWRESDLLDFIERAEEATRTGTPIAPAASVGRKEGEENG